MGVVVYTSSARISLSKGLAEKLLKRICRSSEDDRSEAEDPLVDAITNGAVVTWSNTGKGVALNALTAWLAEPGARYLPYTLIQLRYELSRDLAADPKGRLDLQPNARSLRRSDEPPFR